MKPSQTRTNQAERFDLYTLVHKGLRAFMADTLTAVGRIDPRDSEDIANGIARTRALIDICKDHLDHENQFIHPAMEAKRQGSASVTAGDHAQHEEAFSHLESKAAYVERSVSIRERKEALLQLYRSLSRFVADNFLHMHVEETDNTATLWQFYSDEQLAGIHRALVSSVAPQKMLVYLRWMIPSISLPERIGLLGGIQATMPEEVFEHVLQIVESSLTTKEWVRLANEIGIPRGAETETALLAL